MGDSLHPEVSTRLISIVGGLTYNVGSDGIRFWDLKTYTEMSAPHNTRLLDPVSTMVWLPIPNSWTLCYATGLGYLVFVRKYHDHAVIPNSWHEAVAKRVGNGAEVNSLAAGPTWRNSAKFALTTRDLGVQVYILNTATMELRNVFSVQVDYVPIGVSFLDSRDLRVFGRTQGEM
jgi:hypothetical protein